MSENANSIALSGDALETWATLATVLEWLPSALDAQLLHDSDITHFEYGVLYALAYAPKHTLRMSVLASYANSSLSRLSRAALRLHTRGWMLRRPDPDDGRSTLATLTAAGLEKFEQASPGHIQTVNRLVLDTLTPAQSKQLREISRRILRAIRDEEGWQSLPGGAADAAGQPAAD
ncbi:MarR family winged helix-turn-helix transcriptional regulator [Subtercola lobariae]|uniref:MarR family transcriptional regulator n=1 Tax=Subtercola lobariae TaxID=1588641 RepID=A0A917B9E5_9MICO|nr:MarR family transcriptional regulator [Subtercola lobariae]GGF32792.1 MarR family transcriptional regulator [Subtercola lobariae]